MLVSMYVGGVKAGDRDTGAFERSPEIYREHDLSQLALTIGSGPARAASARRRTSASAERSAERKAATPPLASMSATTRAPLSASRPCTSTCAPACPSLRATSRPTPSVEPVTSAVFPLSFSIAGLLTGLDERD